MQEAKRATEDEMVGQHHQQQHHRVNEFEQAQEMMDFACCPSSSRKLCLLQPTGLQRVGQD